MIWPGYTNTDPHTEPSTGLTAMPYRPATTRLSFVGSTGSLGSTHSSRLPLPLVSRTNGVQPWDLASSPVSSNIFRLIQPTTLLPAAPLLNHKVLFASSANTRWCVLKQVLINVNFFELGSYMETCRLDWLSHMGSAPQ